MYKYFTDEYYDEWSNHHRSYMPEECPLDNTGYNYIEAVEAIDRYLEQYGYGKDIRDKMYNMHELVLCQDLVQNKMRDFQNSGRKENCHEML